VPVVPHTEDLQILLLLVVVNVDGYSLPACHCFSYRPIVHIYTVTHRSKHAMRFGTKKTRMLCTCLSHVKNV